MNRVESIRARLQEVFSPQQLVIDDDSAAHAGHAGARGGAGHFRVSIVSGQFSGLGAVARHRKVYEALTAMMGSEIHALSIQAKTPDEV